jgi:2,3-bisphosphoglycerate-dependent phosphoglycerate mutase
MQAQLVLLRHGQSEWNKQNLFTGWQDVELTDTGRAEARAAGMTLARAGLRFDVAFTSRLKRARRTLDLVREALGQTDMPIIEDIALNERDYGALTGLNKEEARSQFGDEQVFLWRRSYDVAPPEGESLKDTADRVIPYFEAQIVPRLKAGERILVVAHGNSLRSLIMRLDNMTPEEIVAFTLATAAPVGYAYVDGVAKRVPIAREAAAQ